MAEAVRETMQCMEVWGGNSSTWSHFNVPGLDLWVYSEPLGSDDQGGDVYYLSSCASGRTTRLLVGDVSGHGEEASPTAESLKQIVRQNVNLIDHSRLVNSVNQEFERVSAIGRFATAVVGTYFLPTRRLTICAAGHPLPLKFNALKKIWECFASDSNEPVANNLPFGIDENHPYRSTACRLAEGDMVLCYTDALYESYDDASDTQLRTDGLLDLLNSLPEQTPESLIPAILESLKKLSPRNLQDDDVTILLTRANKTRVSFKNEILAPFRLLNRLTGRS
ncbi:PP2C family protein-serine/threonine phosphatase [Thalassoglobus sp. JC818]|uniref:PP2C family protein-serine/threonine phosphatase n=1 Tax=Thalassoglobus sp. JC818 TaxID=3232136 RepID=UPI003457F453